MLRVHPTQTYNYAKRNFFNLPVIDVQLHGRKCTIGESWLYFAIPAEAARSALRREDRLYVGAQTQDRMFRGDGLDGRNFHHAEMRAGNGEDSPEAFLKTGYQIAIYRVSAESIAKIVPRTPRWPRSACFPRSHAPRRRISGGGSSSTCSSPSPGSGAGTPLQRIRACPSSLRGEQSGLTAYSSKITVSMSKAAAVALSQSAGLRDIKLTTPSLAEWVRCDHIGQEAS